MRWIALMLLTLLPANLAAWNEPDGFEGFRWGTSEITVREKFPTSRCVDLGASKPSYRTCSGLILSGIRTILRAEFIYRNGGLVTVDQQFPGVDFELMAMNLMFHYGDPTLEEHERLYWKGNRTSILLVRHVATKGDAMVLFMEAREGEEILRRK